jgi:hypothetical protein
MPRQFKRGDRVSWSSEAGRVTGIVQNKITSEIVFKGYKRHASKEDPQPVVRVQSTMTSTSLPPTPLLPQQHVKNDPPTTRSIPPSFPSESSVRGAP